MSVTVFGGGAVQTAYVSFTALDIKLNSITLVWPTSYFDVPSVVDGIHYDVLAASFTVDTANANAHTITLPNATESSVGSNFIIKNIGMSSFRLLQSNGDELIVIPNAPDTANAFWVQLTDNSTPKGDWQFVQFGAGTSQAQAAALAGNGLVALAGLLNTDINVKSINNTPYQVLISDRAKLLLWQTGNGSMLLPPIATPTPNGFYISVNNEGTGRLTISCADGTIDNSPSIEVAPGQSLSIISNGVKWWTLGFGQNIASSNFAAGNSISPSITFTDDIKTGIYYYQTPPLGPPGIGFSVNSSQIANLNSFGLYMNAGNFISLQDFTLVAETSLLSNANYGQLTWNNTSSPLANPPTLNISGTNTQSTLELGPFGVFTISQSATNAFVIYNENLILNIDNTGKSVFPNTVGFSNTGSVIFDGPLVSNSTATFNGTTTFNNTVLLSTPLSISNGGTSGNNRTSAINALLPPAPPIGSMIYYDHTNNWVLVSPGIIGNTLTLVDDGLGNPVPKWA